MSSANAGASIGTAVLRRRLTPAGIVAAVVLGIHLAALVDEAEVVVVYRLATLRGLEKVSLHDLLRARLEDAAVDADRRLVHALDEARVGKAVLA